MNEKYNKQFFEHQKNMSILSAKEVVPLIINILDPKSVVDLGCGTGTWLSVFLESGISDILGIDGPWARNVQKLIPETKFVYSDLSEPIQIEKKFELAISLEVAEHLPEKKADQFIKSLTGLSPVVLFAAAIPGQGGTNHINERWPSYWVNKFQNYKYDVFDIIRRQIWNNVNIEPYYRQDVFIFVQKDHPLNKKLKELYPDNKNVTMINIVHPETFTMRVNDLKRIPCSHLILSLRSYIGGILGIRPWSNSADENPVRRELK